MEIAMGYAREQIVHLYAGSPIEKRTCLDRIVVERLRFEQVLWASGWSLSDLHRTIVQLRSF
jgi:hypothetical protein